MDKLSERIRKAYDYEPPLQASEVLLRDTCKQWADEVAQLEAEKEVQEGETAGEYVARRIMDIFQEVAEHVGNGVFDLDHPAPIIRGSIAMTNAWNAYLSGDDK